MTFGNNAKFVYANSGPQKKKSKFFERFKMALYEDELNHVRKGKKQNEQKDQEINTKKYIKDSAGKP
eukprot:CAMPEP_0201570340 /NCGR_PEP_ID=MMETSP0190_2-20130828/12570_1 /ASSEMBLY_ACC=CAM_ASM_000263 /TAXON_ID=37353 /ORGANISM="Rosalina sp." /LENGTH=66 /DNA_ID=CAMNT_0047993787 /DNA_START=134 /DNA_END=331 /DNA_ORIENTATION=+